MGTVTGTVNKHEYTQWHPFWNNMVNDAAEVTLCKCRWMCLTVQRRSA